jgi:hypothetical protein
MGWINQHKRTWRTAVLILLFISLFGPWSFEKINVPAEYACSPPNFRLEGDFCGVPLAGLLVFTAIIVNFFSIAARLVTGAISLANISRELLFTILYLFLVLPFITTLLLVLGKNRRFRFQSVGWGLAVGIAFLFLTLSNFYIYPLKVWGIWLYILVSAASLILELTLFRSVRKSSEAS